MTITTKPGALDLIVGNLSIAFTDSIAGEKAIEEVRALIAERDGLRQNFEAARASALGHAQQLAAKQAECDRLTTDNARLREALAAIIGTTTGKAPTIASIDRMARAALAATTESKADAR